MDIVKCGAMFGLAVMLAGCTPTQGQLIARQYKESRAIAEKNSKECMARITSDNPVYERLSDLFIYEMNDNRQFTKIVNGDYVTKQNMADLMEFRERLQPCVDQMLTDYGKADYRYAFYLSSMRTQSDDILLALLNKEITIGERNNYVLNSFIYTSKRFSEIDKEVVDEINELHAAEMQLSQESTPGSAVALNSYQRRNLKQQQQLHRLQQMQSLQQAGLSDPRDPQANCRFVGGNIHCDALGD